MEKARSMRVFSNNREDSSFGLRSQWDYVGRHAADRFSLVSPLKLSGGQFETVQLADAALMPIFCHA